MARRFLVVLLMMLAAPLTGRAQQQNPPQAAQAESVPAVPVDFTGTWIGTIAIPEKGKRGTPSELRVTLKQTGKVLSGTIGPTPEGPVAITNGRVQTTQFGTALSFDLKGPTFVMSFQLRPDAGPILRGLARIESVNTSAPVELRLIDTAPRATAAAISGTWIGTFKVATTELLAHIVLDQAGQSLTGTAGPNAYRQMPIANGKVATSDAGTTVSFQMPLTADKVVLEFDLKLSDAGLNGTVTAVQEGQRVVGPAQLKPVK